MKISSTITFKGRDKAVAQTLKAIVEQVLIKVFLILLDEDDGDASSCYIARKIFDTDGDELLLDVPVDHESWLQPTLPKRAATGTSMCGVVSDTTHIITNIFETEG